MSFTDCLLITLFNAVICIALPKVLSLILDAKIDFPTQLQPALSQEAQAKSNLN